MDALERSAREKEAVDVTVSPYSANERLHDRFHHVRSSPNTLRGFELFYKLIEEKTPGATVLDIGCGAGAESIRALRLGAEMVHGIDISANLIEFASKQANDKLHFFEHDVHQPLEQKYDLIFGRAVLHHLNYQEVLLRLYRDNLNPGGRMVFMEPLAQNPLLKLYWAFGSEYHTPDERPFYNKDLAWLRQNFPGFENHPINYTTIGLAIVSSFIFSEPDNPLTRGADRIDTFLAERVPFLRSHFRSGIFCIDKPALDG